MNFVQNNLTDLRVLNQYSEKRKLIIQLAGSFSFLPVYRSRWSFFITPISTVGFFNFVFCFFQVHRQ